MKEYSTKDKNVKLILLDSEEPNYGRMLYKVRIEINGVDATKDFESNWNKIYYYLDKFEFASIDSKYYFFPFESGEILYDIENNYQYNLRPYPELPKYHYYSFIGNKFSENQFVIVQNYLIKMVNLENKSIKEIKAEANTMFEWVEFMDRDTIEVTVNYIEIKGNKINIIGKKKTLYNNGYDDILAIAKNIT